MPRTGRQHSQMHLSRDSLTPLPARPADHGVKETPTRCDRVGVRAETVVDGFATLVNADHIRLPVVEPPEQGTARQSACRIGVGLELQGLPPVAVRQGHVWPVVVVVDRNPALRRRKRRKVPRIAGQGPPVKTARLAPRVRWRAVAGSPTTDGLAVCPPIDNGEATAAKTRAVPQFKTRSTKGAPAAGVRSGYLVAMR
jgi:hypothetical protein